MPSEQRLHPATLLFDLAGHVKRFAVPAVLVMFGLSSSTGGAGGNFGRLPAGWEAWLVVMFLPATVLSIARYVTFRLRYEERELVIRHGLLFRNERHIPFSRIQNVDAVQNAVHRLLGVVEVRLETGGGSEEEARLSVLPLAALDELRARVVGGTSHAQPEASAPQPPVLLYLPLKEVLLLGLLENRGMVVIAAGFGALWETGILNGLFGRFFGGANRRFIREQARSIAEDGSVAIERLAILLLVLAAFLAAVRIVSMIWAAMRLYDFRLTRIGEDLRTEYGLFTRVTATIPLRRVQAITIGAGPLYRLLKRATVRVATAGGAGAKNQAAARGREWLAPLIRQDALPNLLQHVIPGFDLNAVAWQPVHPRAFARAVKPRLLVTVLATAVAALAIGWAAIPLAIALLLWSIVGARQYVAHLGWAEGDEVVMMRSGWLRHQVTLARVNKIQAVTMHETPFDRRAAMARVRVDTAGAGEFSHRVDVPFLDRDVARGLAERLSTYAANTAFRW
jgi:putative membrane protein